MKEKIRKGMHWGWGIAICRFVSSILGQLAVGFATRYDGDRLSLIHIWGTIIGCAFAEKTYCSKNTGTIEVKMTVNGVAETYHYGQKIAETLSKNHPLKANQKWVQLGADGTPVDVGEVDTFGLQQRSYASVKAQDPEILWPTASAILYGQTLADSMLSSADANGSFKWKDGSIAPAVADSDKTEYIVVYTPNDMANYDYTGVALEKGIALRSEERRVGKEC